MKLVYLDEEKFKHCLENNAEFERNVRYWSSVCAKTAMNEGRIVSRIRKKLINVVHHYNNNGGN